MKNAIITTLIAIIVGLVGYGIGNITTNRLSLSGYAPKNPSYTGVYFTTTTDNTLRDGYGGAIRVDLYGRVLISPSSTINLIGE